MHFRSSFVLILLISYVISAPLRRHRYRSSRSRRHEQLTMAERYLNEFGYLRSESPTLQELEVAVLDFQAFMGLPTTGLLDPDTLHTMSMSRCGNLDVSVSSHSARQKRFIPVTRWVNKVVDDTLRLSWYISKYTDDILKDEARRIVRQAFAAWSALSGIEPLALLTIEFEEAHSPDQADINIVWTEGDHGDGNAFDGTGRNGSNTLAHTFFPNYRQYWETIGGDIHLDDDEDWAVQDLESVLVHEIGHALGLGHSSSRKAVMHPLENHKVAIDMDDKCGISWSYVGASDVCLYLWLTSEVIPKRVEVVDVA